MSPKENIDIAIPLKSTNSATITKNISNIPPIFQDILNQQEEYLPLEISYDFELYGFPKNALSLYGVDIGIFITLPDEEKGNFLNEARMNYEDKCKEISPELIQFLYDFEGNGFPADALLKYGIDPFYFMEMPEDYKFAILDDARKKFNQDMKVLLEKEKENERQLIGKIKEKITLRRELSLISEKGCRILKEKRENLNEDDWKLTCDEIQKIKDEGIRANILKRMSNDLINELPAELKKIAYKYRKDLLDFPNKTVLLQEENKEIPSVINESTDNLKKLSEEMDNFFNFEEKKYVKNSETLSKYKKISEAIENSDFIENMFEIPDDVLLKFLHAFILINKKNPKQAEDNLYKTRYFLKVLCQLFNNPVNAYKLLDGIVFLLNDYPEYVSLYNKIFIAKGENMLKNEEVVENIEIDKKDDLLRNLPVFIGQNNDDINEILITSIDFITHLLDKNSALTLILQMQYNHYSNLKNQEIALEDIEIKELGEIRGFLQKKGEKQAKNEKTKNFIDIFFDLLKNNVLESSLTDLITSFDTKLILEETQNKDIIAENRWEVVNRFDNYPITTVFVEKKEDLIRNYVFHAKYFDKNYLKSFLKIFVVDLKDFKILIKLLLSIFYDKFNKSLEETKENMSNFIIGHSVIGKLKDLEGDDNKITLLASFYIEIVSKFNDLKNFSRGLKYLFSRFRRIFKKSCFSIYNKEYMEKLHRNEEAEIIRSWFQEKEKNELSHYITFLKPTLESDENVGFFKNIINNIEFLIDFIGDDCSQENSQITLSYKIFKCGFKAFIYVYSFLNPLEEVEYENLEKEDISNEVPQLSKLLTLEIEDKKIEKIFHLDEVFDMLNEKFCPILDFYVKSCSNTHNNNNLSHAWRYLIQKNTNFSTLSADTKFILIK